jgi:hypothetical protein
MRSIIGKGRAYNHSQKGRDGGKTQKADQPEKRQDHPVTLIPATASAPK